MEIEIYIKYLNELQNGRVKPDKTSNHSVIRDSLDNINDIKALKFKLNQLLDIKNDRQERNTK